MDIRPMTDKEREMFTEIERLRAEIAALRSELGEAWLLIRASSEVGEDWPRRQAWLDRYKAAPGGEDG